MSLRPSLLAILALATIAQSGRAQAPAKPASPASGTPPVIQSIKPPGATRGATVILTVAGQGLAKCDSVIFSGKGLELLEMKPEADNSLTLSVKVEPDAELGFQDIRVIGPDGISNLRTIRVDSLLQVEEREPNDEPSKGQDIDAPGAVTGVLVARDVDHFRLKCVKGQRFAIEVEAQRIGTPISPVVSILAENGASLIQARESRGTDRDCRLSFTVPVDGTYVIQVRDNIYSGGDAATYRLRVETLPFATAIFPLGGKAGQPLVVSASGGNLEGIRTKTIVLPNEPGSLIEVGAFDGLGGPIVVPGKVVIGNADEVLEADLGTTLLAQTATANGRIAQPGEVDRYAIPVKKGDTIRLKIRAADLGSWLDSVIAVVDAKGTILAENDEPTTNGGNRGSGTFFGLNTDSPDSMLDYEAKEDGTLLIEVTDRYGDGGPEFGYRLSALAAKPDFDLNLLIGSTALAANQAKPAVGLGAFGVYNLKPGMSVPINFVITTQGKPGPVRVEIEGLPPGVTATPVDIKLDGPLATTPPSAKVAPLTPPKANQSLGGAILLKVEADAQPGLLSEFRVIATTLKLDVPLRKVGAATIAVNTQAGTAGTRTPSRSLSSFPIKLAGKTPYALVGPLFPYQIKSVLIPGVLLPGITLSLAIAFESNLDPTTHIGLIASIAGQSLTTTIVENPASTSFESPRQYLVQIKAGVGVEPGVYDLKLTSRVGGYDPETKVVPIIVRSLFQMRCPSEDLSIAPGKKLRIPIVIHRADGFDAAVALKINAMPAGLQLGEKQDIAVGSLSGWVELVSDPNTKPVARVDTLQVGAVAIVPAGELYTKLAIPVKIQAVPSDK